MFESAFNLNLNSSVSIVCDLNNIIRNTTWNKTHLSYFLRLFGLKDNIANIKNIFKFVNPFGSLSLKIVIFPIIAGKMF